jgi:hypothetical protein
MLAAEQNSPFGHGGVRGGVEWILRDGVGSADPTEDRGTRSVRTHRGRHSKGVG